MHTSTDSRSVGAGVALPLKATFWQIPPPMKKRYFVFLDVILTLRQTISGTSDDAQAGPDDHRAGADDRVRTITGNLPGGTITGRVRTITGNLPGGTITGRVRTITVRTITGNLPGGGRNPPVHLLVRTELHEEELAEIDVEGVLIFAEVLLLDTRRLWIESTLDQRQ